jgi:exosome complex RNA-binding protein Csl4
MATETEQTHENGVALIAAERERQVSEEGWTQDHDDTHANGELVTAAVGYITGDRNKFPISWAFKPTTRICDLTKAGALIAAEIDRLQRKATHA